MLSPEQIRKRALNRYEDFLRSLTCREAMFPLALFGSGMSRVLDYAKARDAISELRNHSKEIKGFGFSIEWKQQSFRRFGEQQIPAEVSFPTREDFTRFLGKCSESRQFEKDHELIIHTFPELGEWVRQSPLRIVEHATEWDGLLKVCSYLRAHGRPNCYMRELPIELDTKFIERKQHVLSELLPIVASACVGPDATTFETRFGFRQKQPFIQFRFLDPEIARVAHLPFSEFAIPLDEAERLRPQVSRVIVVENEKTFLTLPPLPKTAALFGGGDAVSHLRKLSWLENVRLLYWGDMDTHGFESLSILRSQHPHTESVMMNSETFAEFKRFAVEASPYVSRAELKLSDSERELFNFLSNNGKLLEQERIPFNYATEHLQACLNKRDTHAP